MRQMKKFVLLCVFIFISTSCAAQDNEVRTSSDILGADDNASLKLVDNITLSEKLDIKKNLTIDLNNKTITANVNEALTISSGNVIIKNGTILTDSQSDIVTVNNGCTLTLENVNITAKLGAAIWVNGGKLKINGGKINSEGGTSAKWGLVFVEKSGELEIDGGCVITGPNDNKLALSVKNGGKATLKSGTISSKHSSTIIAEGSGSLITIDGGTVENDIQTPAFCAAYSRGQGKIVLNNGTIKSVQGAALVAAGSVGDTLVEVNGGTIEAASYGVVAHSHNSTNPIYGIAIINGGTIKGSVSSVNNTYGGGYKEGTIKVSGGSFLSTDVQAYISSGYSVIKSQDLYDVVRDTVIITSPTASAIDDGKTLASSALSDGKVQAVTSFDNKASKDVAGTWAWKDSTIMPSFLDGGVTSYEVIFTPNEPYTRIISTEITITVNIPESSGVKAVSVDENGELQYEIKQDKTATLADVLKYARKSPDIKKIVVNERISDVSVESLKELTKLESLDLSNASGLKENTALDLSGVKVKDLKLSSNTKITSLTLSQNNGLTTINANGATNLTALTLSNNSSVTDIDIQGTGITNLDVSSCTSLKNLNAKNAKLTSITLTGCNGLVSLDVSNNSLGTLDVSPCTNLVSLDVSHNNLISLDVSKCTNLEKLDASNNKLLFLDLSAQSKLNTSNTSLESQDTSNKTIKASRKIDLLKFFDENVNNRGSEIISKISSVVEVNGSQTREATYNNTTGIATFSKIPQNFLRYTYSTKDNDNGPVMNITLSLEKATIGSANVQDFEIDSNGNLSYDIRENAEATLQEVLSKLDSDDFTDVKTLAINEQITDIENESLKKLNLESLDLKDASGLTNTMLNLSDVSVDNVEMSEKTNISYLTLSKNSKVKNINANGAKQLAAVTLDGNEIIENLNVEDTSVSYINAEGCSNLKTLNAKGTGLSSLNVDGCESLVELICPDGKLEFLDVSTCLNLEKLQVSGNKLLFLDLSTQKKLSKPDSSWDNQKGSLKITSSRKIDLISSLSNDARLSEESSKNIAAKILSVSELDTNGNKVQDSNYDSTTGIATFTKIPQNSLRYFYNTQATFSGDLSPISETSMDVTLTLLEPAENDSNVQDAEIDSSTGELTYEIEPDKTASLEEVLEALGDADLTTIKTISINNQITEISNESLKKLTGLENLDLSEASELTDTMLDLDGVMTDTVTMAEKTNVTILTLSETSRVSNISASGAKKLTAVNLYSNENIENVDVENTSVSYINAEGCSNLKTLNAKGTGLSSLNVDGCTELVDLDCSAGNSEKSQGNLSLLDVTECTALERLDVSGNRLLFLDLSRQTRLRSTSRWNNQRGIIPTLPSMMINLLSFFTESINNINEEQGKNIITKVLSVIEVDANGRQVQTSSYDSASGVATFENVPKNYLRYFYDTEAKFVDGSNSASILAADTGDTSMDVTLSYEEQVADDGTVGPSGAGCNSMRNEELGIRNLLLFLAMGVLIFTRRRKA